MAAAIFINSIAIVLLWLRSQTSEKLVQFHADASLKALHEQCVKMDNALKAATGPQKATAEQVLEWRAKMASLPVGSPKHTAYKNRLAECDGH